MYADGLERIWLLDDVPLEKMAYDAEAAFSSSVTFDAEKLVSEALTKMGS